MPTFCRHNRLLQNCPICSREQSIELRPVLSSSTPRSTQPRPGSPRSSGQRAGQRSAAGGVRVRRLARGVEDGYHSPLLPGLKSSGDAERLADEIAFATARLETLQVDPPGLYADAATGASDLEERTWLAFLIAYLCPLDEPDPFAEIRRVRTTWQSGDLPDLQDVQTGPRTAHDPARGTATLEAYRAWAGRAGSQAAALGGEPAWTPERRFARAFERLALAGFHREARFDLLVTLGRLGLYDLHAASLALGGPGDVTLAAKRALGIGDPLLLDRRATALAEGCGVPLEALDLALYNWGRGERAGLGMPLENGPEDERLDMIRAALHL